MHPLPALPAAGAVVRLDPGAFPVVNPANYAFVKGWPLRRAAAGDSPA